MKLICECGVNFHSMEEAKLMILKTKEIGGFLAKFQLYDDDLIKGSKDYEFLKSIQLNYKKALELVEYGDSVGQDVFFSVMYPNAIKICEHIGTLYYKVRFKDQNNYDLIEPLLSQSHCCFVSTDHPQILQKLGFKALYCVPKYPAQLQEYYNEKRDISYINSFNGVSDHTSNLDLFKDLKNDFTDNFYWERHCCLSKDCLEAPWSSTFQEIVEVFK